MSLIFDALRKAEREKEAPARGVQVVSAQAWSAERRASLAGRLTVAGLLLLAGIGASAWLYRMLQPQRRVLMGPVAVRARPSEVAAPNAEAGGGARGRPPIAGASSAEPGDASDVPAPQGLDLPGARAGRGAARTAAPPQAPGPAGGASGAVALHLNAISTKDGRRVALLNDRLVFEGDSFDGITVVRIGDAEVEVRVDGERRVVGF
jgi:hypothetical protein